MNFIAQGLTWSVGLLIFMSFVEHQIHQQMMHRKHFLADYLRAVKKVFEHHAVLHHGTYRSEFQDEAVAPGQDRGIRLSIKEGFIEALPVAALIALVSTQGAVMLVVVVCLHHFIWNKIHLEMHKPQDRFFSNWSAYKFLARHHYLHHQYPSNNFNVVLPLADYVLGTNVRPSEADLESMQKAGLF